MNNNQIVILSTINFIVFFFALYYFQPHFLFMKDGSIRSFGIGYRKKTIFPIWIVSIILAILCYIGATYYLSRF